MCVCFVIGYLYILTSYMVESMNLRNMQGSKQDLLKKLTKPFTHLIIQVNNYTAQQ